MDIQLDYSIAQAYVPDVVRVILRQIVRFWIGDFGFWIGDFGFWIGDFGFWIGDFGFWIGDFGFWIGDFGLDS
jgi:hypothetical protein